MKQTWSDGEPAITTTTMCDEIKTETAKKANRLKAVQLEKNATGCKRPCVIPTKGLFVLKLDLL